MKNQLLWLSATAVLCLAGLAASAPPLNGATHRDGKIFPSEYGSDEEVRQLLNLKGLTAQHDLASQAEDTPKVASSTTPGESSSPSSVSSSDANSGMTEKQPKEEAEKPASKEGAVDEKLEKEKKSPPHLEENEPGRLEAGDHSVDNDHIELKRQQLSKPHMRYTPLDLALYVYKTGDEEGVTLAIQELIAEGLMTAEEALNYLREIRENLHYLNLQDEQDQGQAADEEDVNVGGLKTMIKKNSLPLPLTEMSMGDPETVLNPDMDYGLLLERLRGQDYVSTEYSLEEVIYQLAKILFKQAMHREIGSEKALQEVAALLEKEAARGAITPEVEKKVLDIVVNSLVDSMNEENEFPAGPGPVLGGTNLKLPSQSPFSLGNSPLASAGSNFKHAGDFFQLSKTTTKREAPGGTEKKAAAEEGKN
ncbi:uncharacterized protein [Palaemon carinicauda]|uniref:uncharacterized protein n=1 Tax=Palaemon carinicauda TaxID=392227 RepID=UPI0035B633BF